MDVLDHVSGSFDAYQMVKGFPAYVHLKGLAIILLKKSIKALILALRSAFEVKLPRWMSFRASMENQISICLSQEACLGVK